MKTIREYSKKELYKKKKEYESKGSTNVFIYNPIVKIGKYKVGMNLLIDGKLFKIHSFFSNKKANLTLLTKSGKPDYRAKPVYKNIFI